MTTPIYDELNKVTIEAYDTESIGARDKLKRTIENLNAKKLYDEIKYNKNKLNSEDLFSKLQTGDIIPLDTKPTNTICKYGKKCYRKNPTHKLICHNKQCHWTKPLIELSQRSTLKSIRKSGGKKLRKTRKSKKSKKLIKSRKTRETRKSKKLRKSRKHL